MSEVATKPARGRAKTWQEHSAMQAGIDLAIRMLRAAASYEGTGGCERERWMRNGRAQIRFAREYLQELIANPQLLEGFSACLSAVLGNGVTASDGVRGFEHMPVAEYEAGVPGEDGTNRNPDDDEQAAVAGADQAAAAQVIPHESCEYYMQALETSVRFAQVETDDTEFPATYAYGLLMDHFLPKLRSAVAAVDFNDAERMGQSDAEQRATQALFDVQALLILVANVKGGRPDIMRCALVYLQGVANRAIPANAEGDPLNPDDWSTASGAAPAANLGPPTGGSVSTVIDGEDARYASLDRARVLLGILIELAVNMGTGGLDHDSAMQVQERTISLADEVLSNITRAMA